MIRGIHGLFYSSQPEATRAFLRDVLRLPHTDVGEGWLIFDVPEGDLGVHPIEAGDPIEGGHDVSFYCDDLDGTLADLRSRGAEPEPVQERGYGRVTHLTLPGGVRVQLYEPRYSKSPRATGRPSKRAKTSKARRAKPAASKARRTAAGRKPVRRVAKGRRTRK